ncbi:MAG: hypothetical protein M3357_12855 [Actinomycetota bacterium]|jgi:hypothetical protein|nr:hypothetical protein [Actinomycetota bacterium]
MTDDPTFRLTWYRKPFGRRVVSGEHPYFSISQPSDPEDDDALRRRHLSDLAGL